MKARATLLMALPNKDQLKFHSYQDAKLLIEAIEKSPKSMDQTFDRLQKLIGQLEIQGKVWINQKSQENSQKRANTNTEIRRAQKKPRIQSRSQEKSTMVKLQSKKVKPWSTEVNR
ncbi:hypothetical protein Tco_0620212 [Tanacetum coccineum]